MSKDARYETDADSVVRLPPKSDHADQLDKAGHAILQLLHKAAGVAEANNQHALEMAQRFSDLLRTAESQIAELEAVVQLYQERSAQAERWLHRVCTEIEERFIRLPHHAAARWAFA